MDDLHRLSLEVAISILQAESETTESHRTASVKIAKQILAELRLSEEPSLEFVLVHGPMN